MKNMEKGINDMVIYNLGMKKYLMSKQREVMNKAEDKKKKWETKGPWITLGIAIVSGVLLAGFLMYVGVKLDAANVAARVAECMESGW
jgi:hypothetical protein